MSFFFIKQKDFVLEKGSLGETPITSFHIWHMHVRESVRTRDMGMMSHISFIACRILGIDLQVLHVCIIV